MTTERPQTDEEVWEDLQIHFGIETAHIYYQQYRIRREAGVSVRDAAIATMTADLERHRQMIAHLLGKASN